MSRLFLMLACLTLSGSVLFAAAQDCSWDYPQPEKSDQIDVYFGMEVADPYRWMEDESDPRLADWIQKENDVTQSYLSKIPYREALKQRLTELVDYPKYSIPWTRQGKRFFFKNSGLQNQSVLYVVDASDGEPRVLLDPNTLSEDGTVSLQATSVSRNGKYLAYSLARSGSDWNEIHVLTIDDAKKTTVDELKWIKFSPISWAGDGFYYSRYDAPPEGRELSAKNEFHKVYYHQLGTSQEEDRLVYEDRENPQRTHRAFTDRDERYLFLAASASTYGNSLVFKDLRQENAPFQTIIDTFDSDLGFVAVVSGKILLQTDRNAPNRRLVAVDPENPTPEHWTDLIPEADSLLAGVWNIGGKLIVTYLKDAAHAAYLYDDQGNREREIELPTLGVCGFSGEPDQDMYFQSFTSFTYPTVIYQCDMRTGRTTELFPSEAKFNPADFETRRIWYTNNAGQKAPIFVVYKKGLTLDGNNPTLLYGYGGFNINMTPSFSALRLPFLESGGIYAVAILRGGGEYGETWYKSGTLLQKKNVFDDFEAAAEELIREKYTNPQRLAIQGGSNGGLLVGAAMTRRPDLFKAVLCAVGVLDMLRYQKFTIGWAWAKDYGTSEESGEMFRYLYSYSPLHNIKSGVDYPAVLITTSDHDDRVVPAHSFKFAATLQEAQRMNGAASAPSGAASAPRSPALIRIETKAGHGAGKPISKIIEESTDIWAFVMDQLECKMK